ncbi:copper chaperone PCu(A)C [Leptolyngbya sp. 15MV]|nr:copper chaperone PCu(A)C [Leptolyngbya sp. 15MV]
MKTSGFATAAALAFASLGLASCGGAAEQPAAQAGNVIDGMTISEGRLILPAVAGNPGVVYFELAYDGDRQVALNRAKVEGAQSAEFHQYGEWAGEMQMQAMQPLPLKKGDRVSFEPGGNHLMAMELSPELQAGGTTEVTLTVSGGAKHTFAAQIQPPGEDR